MKLYTIGFARKSARQFFDLLQQNGVESLVDIRLRPGGRLAGFTKKEDLRYFLEKLIGCDYRHLLQLAPTDEILNAYRASGDWTQFEQEFQALMDQRGIPETLDRTLFEEKTCCLLCSEPAADHCHRRFVAERLAQAWGDVEVIHL